MRTVRRTRSAAVAALLALASAGCERACGRKPAAPTAVGGGFLGESRRLAVIPEGVEMADAAFSPDGHSVAFVATNREGKSQLFHDGKASQAYDAITSVTFLPGGSGVAFVGQRGGRVAVVSGGKEVGTFDGVGRLQAALDGRVVFSAQRGSERLLVSGRRELIVPGAADPSPWVSGDRQRIVYQRQQDEGGPVELRACTLELADCQAGPTYDTLEQPVASPSGTLLALVASRGAQATVVVVDPREPGFSFTEGGWYDAATNPTVSDAGEVAVLARRGEQQLIAAGGKEIPLPFSESPLDLVAGRGGRTLFTTVADNQVVAFVDGVRLKTEMTGATFAVLSTDGAHSAFVAERGERSRVVLDGVEGPAFDKVVTPRFSPDGSRLVYRARQDGKRFVVVADSRGRILRQHPDYQAVFDVRFSPDGRSVGYGVRSGAELWWKVEPL